MPKRDKAKVRTPAERARGEAKRSRSKALAEERDTANRLRHQANRVLLAAGDLTPWQRARAARAAHRAADPVVRARAEAHAKRERSRAARQGT